MGYKETAFPSSSRQDLPSPPCFLDICNAVAPFFIPDPFAFAWASGHLLLAVLLNHSLVLAWQLAETSGNLMTAGPVFRILLQIRYFLHLLVQSDLGRTALSLDPRLSLHMSVKGRSFTFSADFPVRHAVPGQPPCAGEPPLALPR